MNYCVMRQLLCLYGALALDVLAYNQNADHGKEFFKDCLA